MSSDSYMSHISDNNDPQDAFTNSSSRLSQSPCQALCHIHHWVGIILSITLNIFVNYGLGRLTTMSVSRLGFVEIPNPKYVVVDNHRIHYASTTMMTDIVISVFMCAILSGLFSFGGVGKAVARGEAIPIAKQALRPWRFLGVNIKNMWLRAFYQGILASAIVIPTSYLILDHLCNNGTMPYFTNLNGHEMCYMRATKYAWLKGGLCGILTVFLYPMIELSGLNRENLQDKHYEAFLEKQGVYDTNTTNGSYSPEEVNLPPAPPSSVYTSSV